MRRRAPPSHWIEADRLGGIRRSRNAGVFHLPTVLRGRHAEGLLKRAAEVTLVREAGMKRNLRKWYLRPAQLATRETNAQAAQVVAYSAVIEFPEALRQVHRVPNTTKGLLYSKLYVATAAAPQQPLIAI